jgi:hypothetical protein
MKEQTALDGVAVLTALGLQPPDPSISDAEAARAVHADLADLEDAALIRERRRAAIASALWPPDSEAAQWWREREEAVTEELQQRGRG